MKPITSHYNPEAPKFVIVYRPATANGQSDGSRHDDQPAPAKAKAIRTPRFLTEVLAILETNLSNAHFTVESMAKKIGMSYSSLNRKLGRHTGRSAIQLLRDMRLQRARALLHREGFSVSEVAYETGFTSPAYFSRIFSREMGMPPSAYQSANQKAAEKRRPAIGYSEFFPG